MMNKNTQKSILIGLSASLDSFVAAYLLKIQKENLFAVTFLPTQNSIFGCHTSEDDVRKIKKFCDQLQIPHHVVSLEDEFLDQVKEPYISSKIEGQKFNPCFNCHQFRLKRLYQEMKNRELDRFATGHMAKVLKSPTDHKVSVSSSPDSKYDQSEYFVSLDPALLNAIELPLSDLQKKDIEILAANFSLSPIINKMPCLKDNVNVAELLIKEIPTRFIKAGDLVKGNHKIKDHPGIHQFELAQVYQIQEDTNDPSHQIIDIITKIDYPTGSVWVGDAHFFEAREVLLNDMTFSQKQGQSKPFRGYLSLGGGLLDKEVIVYPKTLHSAHIKIVEGVHSFISGERISIYKRRGKSTPLLAQGRVNILFNQVQESEKIAKLKDLNDEYF